jgi:hypothetical protein
LRVTINYDISTDIYSNSNIDYSGNYIAFDTTGLYLEQQFAQFEYEFVIYLNSLLENDLFLQERVYYWKNYHESYYDEFGETIAMYYYDTYYYYYYSVKEYYKHVFYFISSKVKGDLNTFLEQNFKYYGDIKKTIEQNFKSIEQNFKSIEQNNDS